MCVHIASIHSENLSYLSFHYIQDPNEREQNNPLKSNIAIKDFFFSPGTQESGGLGGMSRDGSGLDIWMTSNNCE